MSKQIDLGPHEYRPASEASGGPINFRALFQLVIGVAGMGAAWWLLQSVFTGRFFNPDFSYGAMLGGCVAGCGFLFVALIKEPSTTKVMLSFLGLMGGGSLVAIGHETAVSSHLNLFFAGAAITATFFILLLSFVFWVYKPITD